MNYLVVFSWEDSLDERSFFCPCPELFESNPEVYLTDHNLKKEEEKIVAWKRLTIFDKFLDQFK